MWNFRRLSPIAGLLIAIAFVIGPLADPAEAQVAFSIYKYAPSKPQTGNYSALHSVAVISAIGKSMGLQRPGNFRVKKGSLDIADWGIDEFATKAVKAYLGSRFMYENVAYDRDAIEGIGNGSFANSAPQLRAALQKLPKNNADAYIVLRPNLDFDDLKGLQGLGLVDGEGPRALPFVIANFEIDIIDAKSLNTIGRASSRAQVREGAENEPVFARFPASLRLKPGDDMMLNEAQRAELQPITRELLRISILETLRALKPDTELPPIGARVIAERKPESTPYPGIRNIAVVSVIGDSFELKADRFIGYDSGSIPIYDWDVDGQIENLVRASLTKRITVSDSGLDRKAVAQSELLDKNGAFAPRFAGLEASQSLDAYLLVMKFKRHIDLTSAGSDRAGIGLWQTGPRGLGTPPPGMYATYALALVDAKTLKLMRLQPATVDPKYSTPFPYLAGDEHLWPKNPSAPTAEEIGALQKILSTLLKDSIGETMLQMDLTDFEITDELPTVANAVPH